MSDINIPELEKLAKACEEEGLPWSSPLKDLGEVESFKAIDFYFDHSFEAYPPLGHSGPVFVASSLNRAAYIVSAANSVPELCRTIRKLSELLEDAHSSASAFYIDATDAIDPSEEDIEAFHALEAAIESILARVAKMMEEKP